MNNQLKTTFALLAVAIAAVFIANTVLVTTAEAAKLVEQIKGKGKKQLTRAEEAPIATSGDNAYIT